MYGSVPGMRFSHVNLDIFKKDILSIKALTETTVPPEMAYKHFGNYWSSRVSRRIR